MKRNHWIKAGFLAVLTIYATQSLLAQALDEELGPEDYDPAPRLPAIASKGEVVEMSGISIIGNHELPKTLFIVPWKNSEVGVDTDLTNTLNEGMQPVDKTVFLRELEYYEFSRGTP
jgi:hypothetical protein